MHPNAQLVENFYRAFARRDYAAMLACYAPDIEFQDEIFSLRGKRVGAMWHMLCAASPDLQITFNNVQADARAAARIGKRAMSLGRRNGPCITFSTPRFVSATAKLFRSATVSIFIAGRAWRWDRMVCFSVGRRLSAIRRAKPPRAIWKNLSSRTPNINSSTAHARNRAGRVARLFFYVV